MTKTFSSADNGSTIALDAEERFTLVLAENPTTGYRWHVTLSPPAIVAEEGTDFASSAKTPGASGERHLHFRATSAGAFELVCHRYREGELPSAAKETFRLTGTVR
jgi:predicted secreted protein